MTIAIIFAAKYMYLAVVGLTVIVWLTSAPGVRRKLVQLGALALPLALLVARILSQFVYRARPFVVDQVKPLISHAADNGFPSDHTLLVMTLAAVVFAYKRKTGMVLLVMGVMVGAARVAARVHYPEDIAVSAVIGLAITAVVNYIIKLWRDR